MDTDFLISIFIDDDIEQLSTLLAEVHDHTFQFSKHHHKYTKILNASQGAPLLSIAAYFGAEKCYQYFADTETDIPDFNCSPLAYACAGGNMNIIRSIFATFSQSQLTHNIIRYYFCPGYLAIYYDHFDVVKWLYLKGYKFTENEISCAFRLGYVNICNFFLEKELFYDENFEFYSRIVESACYGGNEKILKILLTKYRNKKFSKKKYYEYLKTSIEEGNIACLKCLINNIKTFYPRLLSAFVQRSLIYASICDCLDIIVYLVGQGATFNDLTSIDSPLLTALTTNSYDSAEYYLNHLPKIDTNTIYQYITNIFGQYYSIQLIQLLLNYINKSLFEMKEFLSKIAIQSNNTLFFDDLLANKIPIDFIKIEYFDNCCESHYSYYKLHDLNIRFEYDIKNKVFLNALKKGCSDFVIFALKNGAVLTEEIIEASECIKCKGNFFKHESLIYALFDANIDLSKYPNFLIDLISSCGRKVFIYENLSTAALRNGANPMKEVMVEAINKRWMNFFSEAVKIQYFQIDVDDIPLSNIANNIYCYEQIMKIIFERQPELYCQLLRKIDRLNIDSNAAGIIKSLKPSTTTFNCVHLQPIKVTFACNVVVRRFKL